MSVISQNQRLLVYLQEHDGITQYEALNDLGIMRLASRISDLKRKGVNIKTKMVVEYNRYCEKCRVARYELGD